MATRDNSNRFGSYGDIISVDEAAALFNRSKSTISGWIVDGDVKGYQSKSDPRILVSKSEIEALVMPRPIQL